MTRRRIVRAVVAAGVLAVIVMCFTPFAFGEGGRACGPEAFRLYRFVKDELTVWHGWASVETFSFREVCRRHDNCYARPMAPRGDCDTWFYGELQTVCASGERRVARFYCAAIARGFHDSVRLFGGLAYDWHDARRQREENAASASLSQVGCVNRSSQVLYGQYRASSSAAGLM